MTRFASREVLVMPFQLSCSISPRHWAKVFSNSVLSPLLHRANKEIYRWTKGRFRPSKTHLKLNLDTNQFKRVLLLCSENQLMKFLLKRISRMKYNQLFPHSPFILWFPVLVDQYFCRLLQFKQKFLLHVLPVPLCRLWGKQNHFRDQIESFKDVKVLLWLFLLKPNHVLKSLSCRTKITWQGGYLL